MNNQLVESLVQAILTLPAAERALLEAKLFANLPYPTAAELNQLSESSELFEFLQTEPDLYSAIDGEAIEWP
jgi:hypothetical protein